ncbi:MAG: hypothetical protein IPN68_18510 [Bacteroidetes bacterium]|nr:hypothetical protein [Bacteroidota bacterium]
MWIPISIDEYVKVHLKKNPNESENILRVRLEAALDDYTNGIKCNCGKDIWIVGSASSPFGCYSCITGKEHPAGEYEIDSALEKRDKYGRRHIDEMNPMDINGIFNDNGYEINKELIKMPSLCLTCVKFDSLDWEDDILCSLTRSDDSDNETFVCYNYRKGKH